MDAANPSAGSTGPRRPAISRAEWGLLLVLSAIQFTHIMDFMIIMPLGPQVMRQWSIGPKAFGVLVAAYGFAACVASLFSAGILDRFDRKRALLFLYTGFIVSTFLCAIAPGFYSMVCARAFAGMFGGVVAVAVMTIVGDLFADYRRGTATGAVMSAFSIASIFGVPAGLLAANRYGLGAPFALLAFASCLVMIPAVFALPSLRGHLGGKRQPLVGNIVQLASDPNHQRAFLFMIALVLGTFTVVPYIGAYIVSNAGLPESDLPYIYFFGGISTLISLNIIGRLADRFGKLLTFRCFAFLAALTTIWLTNLPVVSLPVAVTVAAAFMVTTSGRMVPAQAMMTACASPKSRGGFLSLNTAVQHFASGMASILSGILLDKAPDGRLTGYPKVGLVAFAAAAAGIYLAGRLRSHETEVYSEPALELTAA